MRTLLAVCLFGSCVVAVAQGQTRPADDRVIGTWTGPVRCLHGDSGDFTMSITRDANGTFAGTMDWAAATSDGRKGPEVPFTTLTIDGASITASAITVAGQVTYLEAVVEGGAITGKFWTPEVEDTWTFTGKKQSAAARRF